MPPQEGPKRPRLTDPIYTSALCCFLALTACICAILALISTTALYARETRRLAKKTKQKLKGLTKDFAVFTAVILTNILLKLVAFANALEPETGSIPSTNAKTKPHVTQPQHSQQKREEKQRKLVREYSRALRESYVPIITTLLNEEAELASSKTPRTSTRIDSILGFKFDDSDRMVQMASYFADWESYPIDKNAKELEQSMDVTEEGGSASGEHDEVKFNPWCSDEIPNAI